jgi:hypothetical protein
MFGVGDHAVFGPSEMIRALVAVPNATTGTARPVRRRGFVQVRL